MSAHPCSNSPGLNQTPMSLQCSNCGRWVHEQIGQCMVCRRFVCAGCNCCSGESALVQSAYNNTNTSQEGKGTSQCCKRPKEPFKNATHDTGMDTQASAMLSPLERPRGPNKDSDWFSNRPGILPVWGPRPGPPPTKQICRCHAGPCE